MGVRIGAVASYFPEQVIDNSYFEAEKKPVPPGSLFRRHAESRDTSIYMGVRLGERLLERAAESSADNDGIDGIICFTGMPDYQYPKDVNLIQRELGLRDAACLSIDTACASFITGLKTARALIEAGHNRRIMILCIMNWVRRGIRDPLDYPQVGDGAAGVILEYDERDSLLGVREKTDSDYFDFLNLESPFTRQTGEGPRYFDFSHDPKYARYFAKDALVPARQLLEELAPSARASAPGTPFAEEVDWFLAHQTGEKLLTLWTRKLGFLPEKNLHTFERYGNMSAVNIPATLDHYIHEEKRIKRGDTLFFYAPGAGMHLSAMAWRY